MSIAIITGASSGIGSEFARQLKRMAGIEEFWFIARRADRMEALRDELGVKAKIITADLSVPEGIEAVRSALAEEKPQVKFLVNAAGFGNFGSFEQLPENDIVKMIDLNDKALVLITHMTIPYMERGGRIIELGSGSCFTPLPNFNIYASSKIFVLHYTKALNFELKKYGIRATCFCPGWVATDFFGVAEGEGVSGPEKKHIKPLLNAKKITRGCLKAVKRGRAMYVTGWYTKMQHVLFKLVPDPILTRIWMRMQRSPDKEG